MLKPASKQHLLALFSLLSVVQQCFGVSHCEASLPQHVQHGTECYNRRLIALAQRRAIFSLTKPTQQFQYPRLNMSINEYLAFLKTEPFWGVHTQLQHGLFVATNITLNGYLKKTKNLPDIPQIPEYQQLIDVFAGVPIKLFEHFIRKPSESELFQNDSSLWITDELFAEQRMAGINPMTLKQVTLSGDRGMNWDELKKTLNPDFDWEDALEQSYGSCVPENGDKKKGKSSLEKAIKDGRIFVLRHRLCDDIPIRPDLAQPSGDHPKRDLWPLHSPIALFVSAKYRDKSDRKNNRRLKPFAIQMDYKPDSKVYTPRDNCAWTLAKLNVQLTDLLHAQLVEHLSKVHFVVEVFCISMERHLSKYHPLYIIMRYHCRGAVTSNTFGAPTLITPRGAVDQLFPIGWQGTFTLVNRAATTIDWEDMDLVNDLKKRGVYNKKHLTYYPYRDDGLVLDKAIKNMAKDYINAYYKTDYDVYADHELRAYVNEVSRDGNGTSGGEGNIKGFPAIVRTKKELIDVISRMIWLMTCQHAAVNFPLSDYAAYPPNAPTKLYNDSRGPDMKFSIYNLPYRVTAAIQNRMFVNLGVLRLDRLFDYGQHLTDKRGRDVLYKHYFHLLNKVEPLLDKRNKMRFDGGHLTYPYFLPRWLPNGVQT